MNWEVTNTLVAISTLAFTIFLEWPRIKDRMSFGSRHTTQSKSQSPVPKPVEMPLEKSQSKNLTNPSMPFLTIWIACAFICALALGIWQAISVYQTESLLVVPSAFAALSLCQWLLLRKRLPNMNRWIIASTLPVFLLVLIGGGSSFTMFMIGPAQGFAQWLILKSRFQKAHIWWIASAVSWPVGILSAFLIPDGIRPFFLYPLEVGVMVYEITRGVLMVRLLSQHRLQPELRPQTQLIPKEER